MNDAVRVAASSLQLKLAPFKWFRMVGIGTVEGADVLIVYVANRTKAVLKNVPDEWEGFRVIIRTMSQPTPGGFSGESYSSH